MHTASVNNLAFHSADSVLECLHIQPPTAADLQALHSSTKHSEARKEKGSRQVVGDGAVPAAQHLDGITARVAGPAEVGGAHYARGVLGGSGRVQCPPAVQCSQLLMNDFVGVGSQANQAEIGLPDVVLVNTQFKALNWLSRRRRVSLRLHDGEALLAESPGIHHVDYQLQASDCTDKEPTVKSQHNEGPHAVGIDE